MNTDLKKTLLVTKEELARDLNATTCLDAKDSLNAIETLFRVLETTLAKGEPIQINDLSLISAIPEQEVKRKKSAEVIQFPQKRDLN